MRIVGGCEAVLGGRQPGGALAPLIGRMCYNVPYYVQPEH